MALLNNLDFSNLTKPTTKEEALDVYHSLSVQLATWAVSDLPGLDAKAIMTLLWAETLDQKVAGLQPQKASCWRASK
jgi:hypothetical protein